MGPKEKLKKIKRAGLGFAAFAELRYENADQVAELGAEAAVNKPDFVLNNAPWSGGATRILVAGENFGCGSSREHAPWAIGDLGIKAIIAPSFADIFFNNCFKNGMLPVSVPREVVDELLADARAGKDLTVDLVEQKIVRECGTEYSFEIDPVRKYNLVNGLDDIGMTLTKAEKIAGFELRRSLVAPWLDGATTRVG